MKIVGRHVNSFVDYDGNIAYVVFTAGCNMDCWYCHNKAILHSTDYLDETSILKDIEKRKMFIDAVVVTGGEPTLQKDLVDFIKKINALNLKVKLDTNGTNPNLVEDLIKQNLLDYVAMDIKAPITKYKFVTEVNDNLDAIKATIKLLINSDIDYEFRTTFPPQLDRFDVIQMAKMIEGAKKYVLQQFIPNEESKRKYTDLPRTPEELKEYALIAGKYVQEVKVRI